MKLKLRAYLVALYVALMANPADILRDSDDPYQPWVIAIARFKRRFLPCYWGTR